MFKFDQLLSILNSSIGLFSAFVISVFTYVNYGSDLSIFFLGYYSIFALSIAVYMNSHYSIISNKSVYFNFKDLIKIGGGFLFLLSSIISSLLVTIYLIFIPDYVDSFDLIYLITIFFSCIFYTICSFLHSRIYISYDITYYNKVSFISKSLAMIIIIILSFNLDFSSFLMSYVLVNLAFSIFVLVFSIFKNKKLQQKINVQKYDKYFSFKLNLITFSYFTVNKLILVFLPNIDFNGDKLLVAYATMALSSIAGILASSRSYIVPELTESWDARQKVFFEKRDLIISQFKFIGIIYIFAVSILLFLMYILSQFSLIELNKLTLNFIFLSILIYYCELNSSSATIMLNASGDVVYWRWSIFTGFLYIATLYIVSLSYNITPFIMIMIQFASMALYQYWKWPILLLSYSKKL